MRHKHLVAGVAALLLAMLAGSQAVALGISDVKTGSYDNIHKIAILTAVGSIFRLSNTMGWGKHSTLDISEWHVDESVVATVKKYLGGRFEYVDIDYDRTAITTLPTRMSRETRTKAFLKGLPKSGADAFLLVHPSQDSDMTGPEGLALGYDGNTALWANFEVDIVDARTFEFIGEVQSHLQEEPGGKHVYAAFAEAPGFWYDPDIPLTQNKLKWLRKQTEELVPRALVECLRDLDLGVSLPPPGDHSIAPPALGGEMEGVKSVAVVSALGDKISLVMFGNLFTSSGTKTLTGPNWALDPDIERIAGEILSKKFAIKPASADHGALASTVAMAGGRVPRLGLPARTDIDAYVVLLKAAPLKQDMNGLGFSSMHPMTGRKTGVFNDFAVVVVDAHTQRVIKSAAFAPEIMVEDPIYAADNSLWPERGEADVTPEMALKMRARLLTLVADTLRKSFYEMDLSADAPSPSAGTLSQQQNR